MFSHIPSLAPHYRSFAVILVYLDSLFGSSMCVQVGLQMKSKLLPK